MLARKIALITGGCSGLGLATAKHFVKNGGAVLLLDLPSSDGDKIAEVSYETSHCCGHLHAPIHHLDTFNGD